MLEPIINFDTAKLAVEKGVKAFPIRGFGARFYHPRTKNILWDGRLGRCKAINLYPAYTQVGLQRYLREQELIIISVVCHDIDYFMSKVISFNKERGYFIKNTTSYLTWEEALEAGIQLTLKTF